MPKSSLEKEVTTEENIRLQLEIDRENALEVSSCGTNDVTHDVYD